MKNYYALLGIESNATKAEIKKNYRKLATQFHPDKNSAPGSAAKFIDITEAYDVLSDTKKRARYNLLIYETKKQARESKESFTTVPRPRESTRTRRNKAQQKRSLKFHKATSTVHKVFYLLVESVYIFSRSVQHILGAGLIVVILQSAVKQLPDQLESSIAMGVVVGAFIAGLIYAMFKLLQNFTIGIRKDTEAFAVFYKTPMKQVMIFVIFVFALAFILMFYLLQLIRQ